MARFYVGIVSNKAVPAGREVLVKPSGKDSKPYSYDTPEEAERMGRMCYPDLYPHGLVRVVEGPPDEV